MVAVSDYYVLLGVPHDATEHEITKSYRRKALQCHPDKNPVDAATAEVVFKQLTEAHEVLKDSESRRRYDSRFATDESNRVPAPGASSWSSPCKPTPAPSTPAPSTPDVALRGAMRFQGRWRLDAQSPRTLFKHSFSSPCALPNSAGKSCGVGEEEAMMFTSLGGSSQTDHSSTNSMLHVPLQYQHKRTSSGSTSAGTTPTPSRSPSPQFVSRRVF